MTFSNKLLTLILLGLTACTAAQSPLKSDGTATFAIFPDRVKATAELGKATKESFGRARTQRLHFTACLQSLATGETVAVGTPFSILDGTGGHIDRPTDPSGCLNWDEDHDISPIAPERNIRVQRQIKAMGNHRGIATLTFNVKPWLEGGIAVQSALNNEKFADAIDVSNDAGGFGFSEKFPTEDRAAVAKSADAASRREDDKTHFEFTDNQLVFNFVKVSEESDYRIDRFLNLSVPYRFNFTLRPLIARRSFSGTMRADPMTEGRVKLTFVFFASGTKLPADDTHYLTSVEWTGDVSSNGMLTGSLVFAYPHPIFAAGRQTVLVEISAPDHSGVEHRSYAGVLTFIDQRGTMLMEADTRDAEKIHQDSQREREERLAARKSPLEEFLATHSPQIIDIDQFATEAQKKQNAGSWGAFPSDVLTREELNYALDHDSLSTRGFHNYARLPVVSKLCRAFLHANVGADWIPPIQSASADMLSFTNDDQDALTNFFCTDTMKESLSVDQLDFIETLGSPVPHNINFMTYSNQEFSIAYSKDKTTSIGFGLKLSQGQLLGLFGKGVSTALSIFGMDISKDWKWNESRRSNFGQSQTMALDVGSLEVLASVRHCVLITGLKAPMPTKPWFICSKDVSPVAWRPEQYYYYSQIFAGNHSPVIDAGKAQVGIKMLVRGAYQHKRITTRLSERDFAKSGFEVFVHARPPDLSGFDTMGPVDGLTAQSVPGAILRN